MSKLNPVQTHLSFLPFTLLLFIDTVFFLQVYGGYVLNKTSLLFQQHLLTLWLSRHILITLAIFKFIPYYYIC